jgi:hypothetical protein
MDFSLSKLLNMAMRGPLCISACRMLLLLGAGMTPLARAQQLPAPQVPVQHVVLGDSAVVLTGPWKFHIGDEMAWAQPGFDDSSWGTIDLTPPPGSYDPVIGSSGYVPGWTARGYKGYSGYGWYRLRINVHNGQRALAIKMPDDFDDAYQVYVNGQIVGHFGEFTSIGVHSYLALPEMFALPANVWSGPLTIAVRMWMNPFTSLVDQDAGGLHGPPVLGQADSIAGLLKADWDGEDRSLYADFFEIAILLLALMVAFGLFWLDPHERAYLWLGIACLPILLRLVVNTADDLTPWISAMPAFLLEDAVATPAIIGAWVLFWAHWFRLGGMARLHRMVWGLVVLLGIGVAMLRAPLYGGLVPVHAIVWLSPLTLGLKLLLGLLLIWVTLRGIRTEQTGGWLALPAMVLVIVAQYHEELQVLHVPTAWYPFGIAITVTQIAETLSLAIITILMLLRFLRGRQEREQWKMEIEQARQVQQVLIPEALPVVPGLTMESEYRPARQVGGDFFQIIAHPADGSVLIVVGDVTGKGLQAGMLVALIVGAIRTAIDTDFDPLYVLQTLNRRLCGRGQAHATGLTLRIAADGAATLANAGHLAPYLNGEELPMEGSLPLGMVEDAEFSVMHFRLSHGDRLMLLSDGIAEAQNKQRELFGFERIRELLQGAVSAAAVATAAQEFGQEDDISVLSVTRMEGAA